MSMHDRIPLRAPINGQPNCKVRNLMHVEREDGAQEFSLPSGEVILVGFTGMTDAELAFAKQLNSPVLIEKLRAAGYHPVTNHTGIHCLYKQKRLSSRPRPDAYLWFTPLWRSRRAGMRSRLKLETGRPLRLLGRVWMARCPRSNYAANRGSRRGAPPAAFQTAADR